MTSFNETVVVNLGSARVPALPYDSVQEPGYDVLASTTGHVIDNASLVANVTSSHHVTSSSADSLALIGISLMFCIIGIVGIVGNTLIIFIILLDRKMRHSVTNLFIVNMAVSDLLIMLFGVPETVQFMLNRGWLLGEIMCKTERYVLVVSLYSSVITAVAVCVERYIAIVHPMKAHLLCSRKKMTVVIALVWPTVFLLGLPVAMFNRLVPASPGDSTVHYCVLRIPGSIKYFILFKYMEFSLFYIIPMLVQIVCYSIIGRHLFAGSQELHRRRMVWGENGTRQEAVSDAMKARKGVVKMLMASVTIYFISYSPHQILLLYNTFSHARFQQTWFFLVLVTAMGYINSAANPILYSIFSQKFREKFRQVLLFCVPPRGATSAGPLTQYQETTDSGVVMSSFRHSARSVLQVDRNASGKRTYGTCTTPKKSKRETWL